MSDDVVKKGEAVMVFQVDLETSASEVFNKKELMLEATEVLLDDCPHFLEQLLPGVYKLSIKRMEDDEAREFIKAARVQDNAEGVDHNSDNLFEHDDKEKLH